MNATFRRNYLYQTTTNLGNLEQGQVLRYLKYDRVTKSYLFLTGATKNDLEELLVVKSNINIEKLDWLGYKQTNGYANGVGLLITKSNQIEIGKRYQVSTNADLFGLSNRAYTVESLRDDQIFLDNRFVIHVTWVDNGSLPVRLVC